MVVQLPLSKNPTGCRWVFTIKYLSGDRFEQYKARLVAQGFMQIYGIYYSETFAPVTMMNTLRILVSLAAHFNWLLLPYDVKNAVLHGKFFSEELLDWAHHEDFPGGHPS